MRQEFEKWYSDNWSRPLLVARDSDGDGYKLVQTQQAWIGWQAAYKVWLNCSSEVGNGHINHAT